MTDKAKTIVHSRAMAASDGKSLTLYGEIGLDWFGEGITAEVVKKELDRCNGDLAVYINSAGGSVFEGLAIYSQLKRYDKGKVTCYVDGLAASIASVIALAGERCEMSPASLMMIHEAQGIVIGNAADMRKCADDLEKVTATICGIYVAKTGMPEKECAALMAAETWLSAEECVKQGFADGIVDAACGCLCPECKNGDCADCSCDGCAMCRAGECNDGDCPQVENPKASLIDTYKNTPPQLRHVPQQTAQAQITAAVARRSAEKLSARIRRDEAQRRSPMTGGAPRPAGK